MAAGVDPRRYVIGFECLDEGDPIVREFPTDRERNNDPDAAGCARRVVVTFGRVRLVDRAVWPIRGADDDEVYCQLVTEEGGAMYRAYRDASYGFHAKLWVVPLAHAQNPELAPFMSWL